MATCRARRAATGVGCALLFVLSAASAADPHTAVKPATSVRTPVRAASKADRKPARVGDPAARRAISGGPTADDSAIGVESPELRTLREAEQELFPPAS